MKFYLISDNVDTQIGMRLAGIEGIVVHEYKETEQALYSALEKSDVAVILITEKLTDLCSDLIKDIKRKHRDRLFITVPDRHGMAHESMIADYLREAVGIKIDEGDAE